MPKVDPPTADQLRDAIDRGKAADKVNVSDPAAAPLGTDAEAAGTPPSKDQLRRAWEAEVAGKSRASQAEPGKEKRSPAGIQQSAWNGRTTILVVAAAVVVTIGLSFIL